MLVSVQEAVQQSVVVIPAAFRPEMLALSLQSLASALECLRERNSAVQSTPDVRIYLDSTGKDNLADYTVVRDLYFPSARITVQPEHIQAPSGTWNILNSIKAGYETGAEYIFLLEEDVVLDREYFIWTYPHLITGEHPAVCPRFDRWWYPRYPDTYTNPGSVLLRATVAALARHINDDYFTRLRDYMDEHFPKQDEWSNLDDGLIRRVCAQIGPCKFPSLSEPSLAYHLGFFYYNKIDIYLNREGDIHERIVRLREMLARVKPTDRYAKDYEPPQ